MKNTLIALLFFSTWANASTCDVPKPFYLLNETESEPFQQIAVKENHDKKTKIVIPKLVNFWATWCTPCRKELPFLQKLNENKSAEIILVNIEDKKDDAEKVLDELNIGKLSTRYEMMEILDKLNIQGLPASVVFHNADTYLGVGILKNEQLITDWLLCLKNSTSE